jgi:hypothetical protein
LQIGPDGASIPGVVEIDPQDRTIAWWPPQEREERLARIEAQLQREPLGGPYFERLWAKDVGRLLRGWEGLPP